MNPSEISMAEKISKILPEEGVWIVDVRTNQLIRMILIFLKALSGIKNRRGLIITIERPHHYLTYLLGIHGISQRNLTYVDIASSSKKIIEFPISLGSSDIFIGGFLLRDYVEPQDYDFILVDNLAHTRMYLSRETHNKIVKNLVEIAKKERLLSIFPIDRDRSPEIYKLLKKHAMHELKWEEVMKIAD